MGQEAGGTAAVVTMANAVKTLGAALSMGMSALAAGWAQSKIGSAGQGTLAERPEERIWVVTLTALPEVIVLLGFVMAILLNG
jgi:V/A-type H+-transporting ATPase subunit K